MVHPVITKLNEAIKIADSYYETLCSNPHPSKESQEEIKKNLPSPGVESYSKWLKPGEDWKTAEFDKGDVLIGHLTPLPDKQTRRKWDKQASSLNAKFERVYNAFKPELKLPYSANDFSWWLIMTDENGLLYRVRLVLDKFKEIRDRLEILPPLEEKATETPGAGGKGEPTYYYVMQDTKEGSKRVSKGILSGEKGRHTFTRLPALAMAEYIRASNEGVKNPKDIEKSVIDNVPEWQKLKTKGQKPNTKYIKKAIKCGIKKATARDVIPFNPIPFKISLDTK